jgi:hypothetical protein
VHGEVVVFTVTPWWQMFVVIVTGGASQAGESANPAAGPVARGLAWRGEKPPAGLESDEGP